MVRDWTSLLKIGKKARIPALITFIQLVLKFLASAIEQEKEMKGIGVRQEEIKLFLLADDIIVYRKSQGIKKKRRKLLKINSLRLQDTK